jgi:DNA-binding NarL/FixJ family response regulator
MPERVEPNDASAPRRLLVAVADADLRAALCVLLRRERWLRLVGEAADAVALLTLAGAKQPDLVLLDWDACDFRDGRTLTRLRELCPRAALVALSVRYEHRQDVLASGVQMFVSKSESPSRVLAAIRAAVA